MTRTRYTTVLTIAGSDGSGGAGIQADLKTVAALGCYGVSVITAVTAQNTLGVSESFELPVSTIEAQLETIFGDIEIDAVKIGMLGSEAVVSTIAAVLQQQTGIPVVLDTVVRASAGKQLLDENAVEAMIEKLFPLATLVTPNTPESALLAGQAKAPSTREEVERIATLLQRMGARSVLVTGGHIDGERCCDCLLHNAAFRWFCSEKIASHNTHGTGCTLSSAIAAFLARKEPMGAAVEKAKRYTADAIRAGARYRIGKGNGPLHHCFGVWG